MLRCRRPRCRCFFERDELPEHTRVALLYGKTFDNITTESKLINKLREAAGALGANGVVLLGQTDLGGDVRVTGNLVHWPWRERTARSGAGYTGALGVARKGVRVALAPGQLPC